MREKVFILGSAPTLAMTPWEDLSADIWTIGAVTTHLSEVKRVDRLFEIHNRHWWEDVDKSMKTMLMWNCPIVMNQLYEDIPRCEVYPLDEVLKTFRRYFTNSISYIIAYAIIKGYKEIHLYGVHMSVDSEYAFERPSCEYFVGWAEGKGIKLYLPPESDLLYCDQLYGYDEQDPVVLDLRKRMGLIDQAKPRMQEEMTRVQRDMIYTDGQYNALKMVTNILMKRGVLGNGSEKGRVAAAGSGTAPEKRST